MRSTLDTLEQYLTDCENKRRRARDRPSNQVLEELRALLNRYRDVVGPADAHDDRREADDREGSGPEPPLRIN